MADLGPIAAAYPSPTHSNSPASVRRPSVHSSHGRLAMSSSLSPVTPSQSYGDGGGQDKSPLGSLNLNFLKTLTDKRTTRDGSAPKRRGPKPDSKPALTRRQELNRQAQRTHRERKELYIKALEDEVLRLKEVYSNASQDKERLASENQQLKQLLARNGISLSGMIGGFGDDSTSNPSIGYASSTSGYGGGAPSSHTSAFTPPPLSANPIGGQSHAASRHANHEHKHQPHHSHSHSQGHGQRNPAVDYDQAGIDFVLTLEKPCMDHLPWLLERGIETGGSDPCGHALMASCPPEPFPELTPDIPFGYANVKGGDIDSGQRTWELSKADLNTLLDLSKRLNLDGEITPVMAWGMVLAHPRLAEMSLQDFQKLTEELGRKVRCYGFGAVMEEFEVRDALENVFSTKPEIYYQPRMTEYVTGY
ncbi:hypothetical protein RB594_001243 [Gaeumannomyces avenae]